MADKDLTSECIANLVWQWGANMASCFQSLVRASAEQNDHTLNILLAGQGHNPSVQELYRVTIQNLGWDYFWNLVATASYTPNVDLAHAEELLQKAFDTGDKNYLAALNNIKTLYLAGDWWGACCWAQFIVERDDSLTQLFRACVRDHRDPFFGKAVELMSH